jgi:hypothetical protein
MLFGGDNVYSEDQAITGAEASTKQLNHGVGSKIGDGTNLYLVVIVKTAFTFGTATYLQIQFMDSADDTTYDEVIQSDELAESELVAGARFVLPLPPGIRQYTQVYYGSDGTITAGAVDAFLAPEVPTE